MKNNGPKSGPNDPRPAEGVGETRSGPRAAQERTKGGQELPKTPNMEAKSCPRRPRVAKEQPRENQERQASAHKARESAQERPILARCFIICCSCKTCEICPPIPHSNTTIPHGGTNRGTKIRKTLNEKDVFIFAAYSIF